MIMYSDGDILERDGGNNVILQQVPCYGQLISGLPSRVNKKYSDWYCNYKDYCYWFSPDNTWNSGKDYTNEIRGTFHRFPFEDNTIICSAFAIDGKQKEIGYTSLELWEQILRKIIIQTKNANSKGNVKWKIHIQDDIGKMKKNDDNEELIDLFKHFFEDSSVTLVIHRQ